MGAAAMTAATVDAPYFFIVNPRAGFGLRRFSTIAAELRARGIPFSAAATTGAGDAHTLARLACRNGFRAIVGMGGDGTMNEIVNGLADSEGNLPSEAVIGIIPAGTAQDFARGLGVPLTPGAALQRLLEGEATPIDVGRVHFPDGRIHLFANMLGAGFDAEVADRAQQVRSAFSSIPAHVVGFATVLAGYRTKEITLSLEGAEGGPKRVRSNLVVVANGPSYAGVMRLAPNAVFDDGLLDVVVIGDVDPFELLLHMPRVLTGSLPDHPKVTTHRARAVSLESGEEALVQVDGEVVGRLPVRVDLLRGGLRVIR
jgi:diacylglycerol kinase (ATP)